MSEEPDWKEKYEKEAIKNKNFKDEAEQKISEWAAATLTLARALDLIMRLKV